MKNKLVMERLGHKGVDKMKNTNYDECMVLKNHCYQRIEASINVTSRENNKALHKNACFL